MRLRSVAVLADMTLLERVVTVMKGGELAT